ncbi:hypothetical protein ACF3DV_14975 [Chlorogloeopsis fritschii PCC 9212]|nr:hypothetical protein [Chlorogloeopsis fritschii]MBF2009538.1 hypothetical protein [Chlorogloeopsis fritschii C42_A2020_084]
MQRFLIFSYLEESKSNHVKQGSEAIAFYQRKHLPGLSYLHPAFLKTG